MADGCDRCEFGWRFVDIEYANRLFPEPEAVKDVSIPEADRKRMEGVWRARHAGALNSVIPCKECCGMLYERWAGGHLASNHDRSGCAECQEAKQTKKKPDERPRKEVDF